MANIIVSMWLLCGLIKLSMITGGLARPTPHAMVMAAVSLSAVFFLEYDNYLHLYLMAYPVLFWGGYIVSIITGHSDDEIERALIATRRGMLYGAISVLLWPMSLLYISAKFIMPFLA